MASTAKDSGPEAHAPPEVFVCPISREIMRDPVVLVETGQIYDKESIKGWFIRGRNTCPLTGKRLLSQHLTQVHMLRMAIEEWASRENVELGPSSIPPMSADDAASSSMGPLDDPAACMSIVSSKGVSVYDIDGLCALVEGKKVPEAYAALVVMRDMVKHADEDRVKSMRRALDLELLKQLLWEDRLQVPAARLLVQMRGVLDIDELLSLLVIQDVELQVDVLTRLIEHICENRGHMQEAAGAVGRWVSGLCSRFRGRRHSRSRRPAPP
ncbi:unnamed protein product [Ostreobium quekettii]|uniref:U-box domain-containing protein n=1 Tax=Ostreobium quekettii TaxID=121088 RepID=A0A8S1IS61_9CHLO|nr:unnamed protein product [Ostreobium quekettii]|eukprot:evm.model.scf_535.5 EVM.evm.TU.scf_535.5   scf_535:39906-42136(-)